MTERQVIAYGETITVETEATTVSATVAANVVGVVAIRGPLGPDGPPGQGTFVHGEILGGAKNFSNTIYTTVNNYKPNTTELLRNGLFQLRDVHYRESGPGTLTIDDPPGPDDDLAINYEQE